MSGRSTTLSTRTIIKVVITAILTMSAPLQASSQKLVGVGNTTGNTGKTILNTPDAASATAILTMQLQIDCSVCNLPDEALVIDASTGKSYWYTAGPPPRIDERKRRFGKGERVTVVVINKNPFLFKYNVAIQETVITEQALLSFLKVFSTSLFGGFAASGRGLTLPADPPVPATCPANARAAYNTLIDETSQLAQRHEILFVRVGSGVNQLRASFLGIENAYRTALRTFSQVRASSASNSLCQELCTAANTLRNTLAASTLDRDFDRLQAEIERFKRDADAINSKINDFITSFPDCQPRENGLSVLRQTQFEIQRASAEAASALEDIKRLRETNKEFMKMKDNIEMLASRPELLQDRREIGPFDVPTNVTVRLESKSIDAKDSDPFREVAKAELNFGGGPRFSVSGGAAIGLLERPEFKPIVGFERDIEGNIIPGQQMPTTIIELTDEARRRITPILMLNTRLTNFNDYNLFMSLGITGSADSTGTNIEYLFGPSLNILDGRVFITGGVYGGRVQRLNPNQFIGLRVPDSTTAEKIVSKDFVWKTGFAITYKIR